jgi:hypothetical protein
MRTGQLTVADSCCCGAALTLNGNWTDVKPRHDAWLAAHEVCRNTPPLYVASPEPQTEEVSA